MCTRMHRAVIPISWFIGVAKVEKEKLRPRTNRHEERTERKEGKSVCLVQKV